MKSNILLIFVISFLGILIIGSLDLYNQETVNDLEQKHLHHSATSDRIHIDGNWTEVKMAGICTGEGSSSNPYVIEDLIIDGGGIGYCILINNSDIHFIIQNCSITNGGTSIGDTGLKMVNVDNGVLQNNSVITNCSYGFNLERCDNNLITRNTFTCAGSIRFSDSFNNRIFLNNFDSPSISIFFVNSTNYYSSPSKLTYIYQGNTFTNYLGNFWEGYGGEDANNDGIGDTPVEFTDTNTYLVDNYPIIDYFENYEITNSIIPGYDIFILIGIVGFISSLLFKMRKLSLRIK